MPSFRFGFSKHTQKSQDLRNGPASTKNGFSALEALGEEQDPVTQSNANKEINHALVPEITTKLATTIPEPVPNTNDGVGWEPSKPTRRSGRKNTVGKTNIPNGNWNGHKEDAKGTTLIGKSVRHGTRRSNGFTANTRLMRGRRTRSGVAFADQNPGSCVWHYDYRPVLHRNIGEGDPQFKYIIQAPDGSKWIKKGRFWIIIARTRYTVTEVPVYSYDDTGLENKPETKSEYPSLKALKIVDDKLFVNQSPENPVLAFEAMRNPDEEMRATMMVHYTEAITRDVDVDDLRYVGNITFHDGEVLQKYAKDHIGKAPDDH
ncbi:hypothetical protein LTR36_006442 [Oleoguttula mirabilis]|uniref:Uncharacterized protein n=1 Tax=Oleoguttula mirabilis TaxID=1507867 RepID=A0AAV9JVC3_9PEZI|nr:hypothetical protein LTR36_006442 [Oleoguttula mirabilis]